MVSLFLSMAWLATALAEGPGGDGDGPDGDEVVWPILLGVGGLVIVGWLAYSAIRGRHENDNDTPPLSRR